MAEKKNDEVQVIKKKPRGGNSPVIGNNGLMVEAGDNTKYLNISLKLFNLPDIDLTDVEQVQRRLEEYFMIFAEADVKPTVVGMAIALNGHTRQWLWQVTHDAPLGGRGNTTTLPPTVTNLIKKAYIMLENQWESYMQNGKLNPVSGIFLGKNNFGYQDKTEYVVTPNTNPDDNYDPNSIRQKYLIEADSTDEADTADSE